MNSYSIYSFQFHPHTEEVEDLLTAFLVDMGFDSFQSTDEALEAYLPSDCDTAETTEILEQLIRKFPLPGIRIAYSKTMLEQRNWNAEWEDNSFHPIVLPSLCCIHKPQDPVPDEAHVPSDRPFYDILLQPRMAFGSGTHETTSQLVKLLLGMELSGQRTLDMGTGTGILGICMSLRSAEEVVAIDIDEASVENAQDNARLNGIDNMRVIHGDASAIEGTFDLIVANIHRNIILEDMPVYVAHLAQGGSLVISGFYTADVPSILRGAEALGLELTLQQEQSDWAVLLLRRN